MKINRKSHNKFSSKLTGWRPHLALDGFLRCRRPRGRRPGCRRLSGGVARHRELHRSLSGRQGHGFNWVAARPASEWISAAFTVKKIDEFPQLAFCYKKFKFKFCKKY